MSDNMLSSMNSTNPSQAKWCILHRDGSELLESELPERPEDAQAAGDQAFTPWYKPDEHLHVEDGKIQGIHARGTLEEVRARLSKYLLSEAAILQEFGGKEDIFLPRVEAFLEKRS